jgi:hypothetical protein
MSVAEIKASAATLSTNELGELSRYIRELALQKELARPLGGANGPLSLDDPLLNLATFAVPGPDGNLTNEDIDRTLYGRP